MEHKLKKQLNFVCVWWKIIWLTSSSAIKGEKIQQYRIWLLLHYNPNLWHLITVELAKRDS